MPRLPHRRRPKRGKPCVRLEDVSARYQGAGADSLSHISFAAGHGETVGIIGGTGSGKTTLVNLIPRFYDVSAGRVLVDGVDVREQSAEALRQKIAVVPQKAVLFRGNHPETTLRWGDLSATDGGPVASRLEAAQAAEVVRAKPRGLGEMVEQGGHASSPAASASA